MDAEYTTPGGISYSEMVGYPIIKADDNGPVLETKYKIAWADNKAFMSEALPATLAYTEGVQSANRLTYPDWEEMAATSVDISPLGGEDAKVDDDDGGTGCNQYTTGGAIVSVTYRPDASEQDNDMLFKHDISLGCEFMTLPKANLRWVKDGGTETEIMQQEDVPARKLIPTMEHALQVSRLVRPNFLGAALWCGGVNGTTFPFNSPKETVLFLGLSANKAINTDGTDGWDVTWRFAQRIIWDRNGWIQMGFGGGVPDLHGEDVSSEKYGQAQNEALNAHQAVNGWVGWNHWYDTQKAYWRKIVVGDDVNNIIFPWFNMRWLFVDSPV
jgi:hypothetical protein